MMWQGKMFEVANRADAKPIYQKVFTYFFLVLTFSATGMFLFSREIIKVMADQAYYEAYSVIPWIAFAFALNGVQTFFQLGMLLKNKTSYLGVSTLLVGLLALPAYHYSINFFGLNGAAIATTTLYLAFAMTSYVMSQIFYPIRLEIGRLLKIIMTAVMIMIVSQLFVVGSLLQGLILKFFLFLLMPALLFLSGFLTKEEQQQLMQLFFAKSRRGSAKYILTK
jgi:O-antigen/teichoic acid export membrane protein